MDSTRVPENEVTVIRLKTDYGSAQFLKLTRLETQLGAALDVVPQMLLLDLTDTICIGAAFVSVLVRCHTRATSIHCRFALCAVTGFPADVVAITRLDSVWLMYDSRQGAVEDLVHTQQSHR